MSLPDPPSLPPDPHASFDRVRASQSPSASSGRARRRRGRGQLAVPQDAEGRSALLQALARRAYPSYELFIYAILCGALLGLGYVIDSQALLLFGILLAPLLTPWVGLMLATITGSPRFFFETLMALLVSAVLVFLIGILAGFAARPFLPRTFNEAFVHSRLWWPDLIVVALGAIILTISFIRSEAKPFLPSLMVAYGFFLPLSAGGFGLGSGIGNIWPEGLLVFFVHFAWAGMFGLLTLAALRFMPTNLKAFVFSAGVVFVLVLVLLLLMSGGNWTPTLAGQTAPTQASNLIANLPTATKATPDSGASATPLIETLTPTATLPPTPVPLTLEVTLPATETPTVTLTIEPTPVYARVRVSKGGGAVLRETAGGKGITILDNFTIVQILPDTQDVNGTTWAHVIAMQNGNQLTGWMVQLYLDVATPVPNWVPSATPTTTLTP